MTRSNIIFIFLLFFALVFSNLEAQISEGGMPYSFENYIDREFQNIELPAPEITDADIREDISPPKIGKAITVYYTLNNSGKWFKNENGLMIWRLGIKIPGAKSLGLNYSSFHLTGNAKVYIYDANKTFLIGSFTQTNNSDGEGFATELTPGDEFIIELSCSQEELSEIEFVISDVVYVYRYSPFSGHRDYGDSGPCEVNVNCPEGKYWNDQKRGVARILLKQGSSYYWCTGSLINNVRQDTTPYFLTANHCGLNSSVADYNKWVFYFNFECPDCICQTSPGSRTITGSAKIATGTDHPDSGSDFKLLLLNNDVPKEYQPYYCGWSRENSGSSSGIGLHHPRGDVKKISTYTSQLSSSNWSGTNNDPGAKFWKVIWSATTSGHGVTEPGSSGSPIFDKNKRIIGQLTGGSSSCSKPNNPDYYGKFWYSWESNLSGDEHQLKPWLDPDNSGTVILDGLDYGLIKANFSSDIREIYPGDNIIFTDSSNGNPDDFSWTFYGGNPPLLQYDTNNLPSDIKVIYENPGNYSVSLIISKDIQSSIIRDERLKVDYISVRPKLYPNPYNPDNKNKDPFIMFFGKSKGLLEIEIFSIWGELVKSISCDITDGKAKLRFDDLRAGAYILKYELNGQQFDPEKLIIN